MAGSKENSNVRSSSKKRGSSPKSGHCGRQMDERRVEMRRSWRRRARSSPSPSSTDSSSSDERKMKRVERAQRILERKHPAYGAWRDEERTREREKDLRRQGEASAAAMASRWDDAPRRCAIMPTGMPQFASAPVGLGGAFQLFPPMPPLVVHPTGVDDDMAAPTNGGRELTRSQVGWLDLLFRSMVTIPVDCTLEEACRLISARTETGALVRCSMRRWRWFSLVNQSHVPRRTVSRCW